MKLVQYEDFSVSNVEIDYLMLKHQVIRSYSAECTHINFQQFMG